MSRKENVLQYINQNGSGIEIGPSYEPVAPKREGFNVQIIDYLDREQLVTKYKDWQIDPERLENIEDVDFVWQGESYSELTGKSKHYDWIIASHVIEHTPDLIGFLNDCDSILKDDGVISLVVPDKRYCFDHYRPITGISKIIDNHISKNSIPTPGAVAEFFLNRVSKAGTIAWDPNTFGQYKLLHGFDEALREMRSAAEKEYVDVHTWCFVPHSFRLLINDLFALGMIPFQEVGFSPTEGFEFYIALSRNGRGIDRTRLEMLEIIEVELQADDLHQTPLQSEVMKPKSFLARILGQWR